MTLIRAITAKYNKAGYPQQFMERVIRDFITPSDKDESFIIPPNMFTIKKLFLLLEIPYCEQNNDYKRFIKKFHQFTGEKYDMAPKWLTKKVKSLFPLKDRNLHPSCRPFQERRAIERARAHTRAKAFRSVLNRTSKSDFSLNVFTT